MDSEFFQEDFIDFKCPHCGSLNSFATSAARLVRECMNCLELLIVPAADGQPAGLLPIPRESSRLRLRKFQPTDWRDLLEFEFDDEDDATGWIHRVTNLQPGNRLALSLAIENKQTSRVIGILTATFTDVAYHQMDLAFSLHEAACPAPLHLEMLQLTLDFCFRGLNLHRVKTECDATAAAQRQSFRDAGFRLEGEFIKHVFIDGEWRSTAAFAMLQEEFSVR